MKPHLYRIFFVIFLIDICFACRNGSMSEEYIKGVNAYKSKEYETALYFFNRVSLHHDDYENAQSYIDTINHLIFTDADNSDEFIVAPEVIETPKSEKELAIEDLDEIITSITQFNGDLFYESKDKMQLAVGFFADWYSELDKYSTHEDSEVLTLVKKGKQKLVALQKREFPKFRKAYGTIAKEMLWEHDIEVKTKGTGNTTIEFTASVFARNKNIKDVHETLRDILYLFRFKKANYKWSKYDDEYTYYDMSSKADSEI